MFYFYYYFRLPRYSAALEQNEKNIKQGRKRTCDAPSMVKSFEGEEKDVNIFFLLFFWNEEKRYSVGLDEGERI